MTSYAYLGPEGTFTQSALNSLSLPEDHEQIPAFSIREALDLLESEKVAGAMVPIENSIEGSVSATVDAISQRESTGERPFHIIREVLVPVRFVLATKCEVRLENITTVYSHPHAWAQTTTFVHSQLPSAIFTPASSTAAGAQTVSMLDRNIAQKSAVICSEAAAQKYGLKILKENIGDNHNAMTRFVFLVKDIHNVPEEITESLDNSHNYVTTLTIGLPHDKPGALSHILSPFMARDINLTRIESRPTGKRLGDYFFSIDFEGKIDEPHIHEALAELRDFAPSIDILGSYPRAYQWNL